MKYYVNIKVNNGKNMLVRIDKPELIYGATAIISPSKIGEYGINPITKERLDFIVKRISSPRFFVPAHIKADYEYARKHGLEIRQCIAPYFLGEKEERPNPQYETQERQSVVAIIKNAEEDSYLCEDAKGRNCKSFVMGGIEEGETPEEAAIRETIEETGYKNVKADFVSNFRVVNHFFAGYKGVNRYAYLNFVFGHLVTNIQSSISDDEKAKHNIKWVKRDGLADFINISMNKLALKYLLDGESAYTGNGVMITSDGNNRKLSTTVRKIVVEILGKNILRIK